MATLLSGLSMCYKFIVAFRMAQALVSKMPLG
jgi:hypothetical protein